MRELFDVDCALDVENFTYRPPHLMGVIHLVSSANMRA